MAIIYKNPGIIFGNLTFDGDEFFTGKIELSAYPIVIGANAADPGTEAAKGKVYTKVVAGKTELFYLDAAGNAVQITDNGAVVGVISSLDAIPDGVTYARTRLASMFNGFIKQLVDPVTGFSVLSSITGADRTLTMSADVALNQNLRTTDAVTFNGVHSTSLINIGTTSVTQAITSGTNGIVSSVSDSTGAGAATSAYYAYLLGAGAGGAELYGNTVFTAAGAGCTAASVYGVYSSIYQYAGSTVVTDLMGLSGKVTVSAIVLGNTPTRYVAGVVGAYTTPGINPQASFATAGGKAAIVGRILDGVNNLPMSVFLSVLEGNNPALAVKVHSAFKAVNYRTTVGIGYDYGLDLYNEAGIGKTIITAEIRMSNGNLISNLVSGIVSVNCELTPVDLRLSQISTPTNELSVGKVYTKNFAGATELCYLDSAGNESKITEFGFINPNFFDIYVGQDAYVTRDIYAGNSLFVGGGYGTTGFSVDTDGNVAANGTGTFADLMIGNTNAYYLGYYNIDNSWRIIRSGNDLLIERLESGIWVTKSTILA